ncbi:MAG: DUF2304 domain-containing protein [Candidatus Tritonobacter lacicola]|nr:DUF2304 domain-containing protein [Candidatus Tritonobacter lacicola]
MPPKIRIIAVAFSFLLVIYVFDLVRRRHLNEEYSVGWLVAGVSIFILSIWQELLDYMTSMIGAVLFTSTLLFFGLFFIILICLHFSIRISALTRQINRMTQRQALLTNDLYRKLREMKKA